MAIDYKSTWNALSTSERDALMHVAGYTDEAKLDFTAGQTLDQLRGKIGIRPGDTYLEIGCGVGRVGRRLAPLVQEWIGCDVAGNMLAHARARLADLPNVRLVEIAGNDLAPIADESVDAVYCTVVFMHLEEWDRWAYVREAYRVLRPGGRLYCDNINIASDQGWELFLASAGFPAAQRPAHISRCSSVPEFETFFRRAGFRDIRIATPELWVQGWGTK